MTRKLTKPIYWKWKSSHIDFSKYCDPDRYKYVKNSDDSNEYKMDMIMRFLPCPYDPEDIHSWSNGGYSAEYNWALEYAFEFDLVEEMFYVGELDCYLTEEQYGCWSAYELGRLREEQQDES